MLLGIREGRLEPVGHGEDKPLITPERSPAGRAQNRPVEFHVAEEAAPVEETAPAEEAAP